MRRNRITGVVAVAATLSLVSTGTATAAPGSPAPRPPKPPATSSPKPVKPAPPVAQRPATVKPVAPAAPVPPGARQVPIRPATPTGTVVPTTSPNRPVPGRPKVNEGPAPQETVTITPTVTVTPSRPAPPPPRDLPQETVTVTPTITVTPEAPGGRDTGATVTVTPTITVTPDAPVVATPPPSGGASATAKPGDPVPGQNVTVPPYDPANPPPREVILTVPAPLPGGTGATSGVISPEGAIDVTQVTYDRHSSDVVTEADIVAGLRAAGVAEALIPQFAAQTRIISNGESGHQVHAVNKSDSNAWGAVRSDGAPGNSSRGPMQTIPPTFATYHAPGTSVNIYDPTANIAAAWRYISARYGVDLQTGAGLDGFMGRGTGRGVGY